MMAPTTGAPARSDKARRGTGYGAQQSNEHRDRIARGAEHQAATCRACGAPAADLLNGVCPTCAGWIAFAAGLDAMQAATRYLRGLAP